MSDPRMIPADEADNTTPVYTEWQMEAVRSMFRSYQSIIDDTVRHAGLSHMVQDDGDGDWGAIWELIWEKLEDHRRQSSRIARLVPETTEQDPPAGTAPTPESRRTMSNRDRAAEIITPWTGREWGYPEAAADALAAAEGVLAPDLPEPDVTSANNHPVWRADGTNPVTVTDGLTPVRMQIPSLGEYVYTPAAAREQASELLAAAEYAEKEETNE